MPKPTTITFRDVTLCTLHPTEVVAVHKRGDSEIRILFRNDYYITMGYETEYGENLRDELFDAVVRQVWPEGVCCHP